MREEAQSVLNFKQETISHYTAIAGLNETILLIQTFNGDVDIEEEDGLFDDGEDDDEQDAGRGEDAEGDEVEEEEDEGTRTIRALITGRGRWIDSAFDNRPYQVRVIDETGKISLNAERIDEVVLRRIIENLGHDREAAEVIADSILDWRDENGLHRQNGAEDDYYQDLNPPYYAKDSRFDAVAELQLVRGVTPEIYHGTADVPGLKDIFTVAHASPRITESSISTAVEYAVCGDVEEGSGQSGDRFGASDGEIEHSIAECLQELNIPVRRAVRGRARLTFATIETRVVDQNNRTISHVGGMLVFRGDGFRTLRWYDSIYDGE